MLDAVFAVTGEQLFYSGAAFTITGAGINDGCPYATIEPNNKFVTEAVIRHIRKSMPYPPSLQEIQEELGYQGSQQE